MPRKILHHQMPGLNSLIERPLQLRALAQDIEGPHALRVHLQTMDFGARSFHHRSPPSSAGTKRVVVAG
ncbi:hypothetical protein IE4803_PB00122 (plasmid) [Rhizobium etli bv. phaseoli str. IE4803]|nr:hypothetical protein IE4803_PB00122 [Rhizobium etli bv. phaseoli str. IE4803]